MTKPSILFLCTGNSCRSQMAEGWGRALHGDHFQFYSAGTRCHGLNPRAVAVMLEVGINLTNHTSKTTAELPQKSMDYVFTVCSDAHQKCPFFPGSQVIHVGFDDPPRLTQSLTDEEEILNVYRRVRDEIKEWVLHLEHDMESKSK